MNIIRGLSFFAAFTALSILVVTQTNPTAIAALRSRLLQVYFPNEWPTPSETYSMIFQSKGIYDYQGWDLPGVVDTNSYLVHYSKQAEYSTDCGVTTSKNLGSPVWPLDDDVITVVFRGSEELDDWVVDADFDLVPCVIPGCPSNARVHTGFQDALFENEDVIYELEDVVKGILNNPEFEGDKSRIYVTGHSLGGALAQVFSTYLTANNPDINVKMISFGGPRVGNDEFAEWANELPNLSAWRFVNDWDPIPRSPTIIQGYKHAGHLMDMKSSRCRAYYRQVGDSALGFVPTYDSWYYSGVNPTDHFVANYYDIIKNKQNKPVWWPDYFKGAQSP